MYKITTTPAGITIQWGQDNISLTRTGVGDIRSNGNTVLIGGTNGKLLYPIFYGTPITPSVSNYVLVFTDAVTIDGVAQTSVAMIVATLQASLRTGSSQVIISTAGQTSFPTVFSASSSSMVFVNGYLTTAGWTVVGGVVTFSPGLNLGDTVVVYQ